MFARAFKALKRAGAVALAGALTQPLVWNLEIPQDLWMGQGVSLTNLSKPDAKNTKVYVVLGGGPAAYMCIQGLRASGFTGNILLVSEENHLPYDKGSVGVSFEDLKLGEDWFYRENGVELVLGTQIDSVSQKEKTLKTKDGKIYNYDKLCVAADSQTKIPTHFANAYKNFKNIAAVKTAEDQEKLLNTLQSAERVLVVGTSIKAFEVAAGISKKWPEKQVLMFDSEDEPLHKEVGRDIAKSVLEEVRSHGVRTIFGAKFGEINAQEEKVTSVKIMHKNEFRGDLEETLPVDAVVLANGEECRVQYLPPSLITEEGEVPVDTHFRTLDSNIYAVGECASYFNIFSESRICQRDSTLSQLQALHAAQNMAGESSRFLSPPVVTTNLGLQLVGAWQDYDWYYTFSEGSSKVTFYYKNSRCVGFGVFNKNAVLHKLRELLDNGEVPSPSQLTKLKLSQVLKEE